MKIYPKLSDQNFSKEMEEIVIRSDGVEFQFFNENGMTEEFHFEELVRKTKNKYNNLKEIVIHPPLSDYNIEMLILKDEKIVENQLKKLVQLSDELNINLAIVYHTYWKKEQFIATHLMDKLADLLKIVEGKNVVILIENLFMMLDEKKGCSALEICKHMNHPNLRMCLDTTHAHCKATIWRKDFYEMLKEDITKEDCQKYVKQIHFAAALDNDGYIEKKTHGRMHPNFESLKEDVKWLDMYGMKDKVFVTEVSEDDYSTRKDQIQEIKMLQQI